MSNNRERELWTELGRRDYLLAGAILVILAIAYGIIGWVTPGRPSGENVLHILCRLGQDVIANIIPVSLLFILSYLFLRRVQALRSEQETQQLASRVSSEVAKLLEQELAALTEEGLVIHSAKYGIGVRVIDVTQRLREFISAGKLTEIPVSHGFLGMDDPAEHAKKQLEVVYSYAVRRQTIVTREDEKLSLP